MGGIYILIGTRFINFSKKLGIGFIGALITGVICGFLLRIIMRIIALAYPSLGSGVSIQGVISLIGTGISFCLASSILYTYVAPYLPNHWVMKGSIFGIINLVFFGIPILNNPDLQGDQAILTIILFSCVFITGGLLLAYTCWKISTFSQNRNHNKIWHVSFIVFVIPALVSLVQNISGVLIEVLG
ncbi:hypothetical protein [Peribacillus alkalitolerans]|uniref:hypothetical protein n=1 Tax=Peribacillus alkalitolerans TaxID=1550385 RepID=UPI0013D3DEFB|nr:hypothetical protein [Peribacillus alkalitolerans]